MTPKHSSRAHNPESEEYDRTQAAEQAVGAHEKRVWAQALARRFLAWPPPRSPIAPPGRVDAVLGVEPLTPPPRPIDDDEGVGQGL